MATLTADGVEVYYRDQGAGQGVVLLHCSSSTGGQWRLLAEQLADRYRVLVPDLHGYGRTGVRPEESGNAIEAEVPIAEALLGLVEGPVHLVGHSLGGNVAGRAALARPERVASVTMIEPTAFHLLAAAGEAAADAEIRAVAQAVIDNVDAGRLEAAASGFFDYWAGPGGLAAMPEDRRRTVIATMPKLRREWPGAFAAGKAGLAEFATIVAPVLLIEGSATTVAARQVVAVLRRAIAGHDHAIIDGAGHMAPVSHAGLVNRIVERHIVHHSPT
jgi:pimeloyl-ACP methyl ester carboxylesterase